MVERQSHVKWVVSGRERESLTYQWLVVSGRERESYVPGVMSGRESVSRTRGHKW